MKKFFICSFLVLATAVLSQVSVQKQEAAARKARNFSNTTEIPVISSIARGLVDLSDTLVVWASSGSLVFEGATDDEYETTFAVTDATADRTITFPNSSGTVALSPAAGTWEFEGTTADAYETTLSVVDPTADGTVYLADLGVGDADTNVSVMLSTINSGLNGPGLATAVWSGASSIVFEGTTANGFETTVSAVDPTADQTLSIPNNAANSAIFTSSLTTNAFDAANSLWGASNALVLEGATADGFETSITPTDPTADRTITVPNASGTVALSQASTAVSLVGDDQAVTPGASTVIQLSSDDATDTNRTFTLSATGAITGQIYVLIGPASNACEIADTGIQKLSATWSPGATDTLTLLFDGTNFIELARADN